MQDRRITVRELADEVGVSIGSVHTILTADLCFREIRAEADNDGPEAASTGNRTRHAGLRTKWFQLPTWPIVIFDSFQNKNAIQTETIWVKRRYYAERENTA
jgi:hypothetical protein